MQTRFPTTYVEDLPKGPQISPPRAGFPLVRNENDEIEPNPFLRYMRPYFLLTDPNSVALPPDINSTLRIPMVVDDKGPIEIDYAMFQSDGDFEVAIEDPENRNFLMNRQVHVRTIAGTGLRPFIWAAPLVIFPTRRRKNLNVVFRNLIAAPNTVRFALGGRRLWYYTTPKDIIDKYREYAFREPINAPYFYTTDEMARILPAAGPSPGNATFHIRITDDADFECFKSMAISMQYTPGTELNPTLVVAPPPRFTSRLFEESNQRPFSNQQMTDLLNFGNAEFPHIWPEPTLFERNTLLRLDVTNLDNNAYEHSIVYHGRKVFHYE